MAEADRDPVTPEVLTSLSPIPNNNCILFRKCLLRVDFGGTCLNPPKVWLSLELIVFESDTLFVLSPQDI